MPFGTHNLKGAPGRAWAPSGGTTVAAARSELRSFVLRCCPDVAVNTDQMIDGREDVTETSFGDNVAAGEICYCCMCCHRV